MNTEKKKTSVVLKFAGIKNLQPIGLSYNPAEHALIINFGASGIYRFQTYFLEDSTPEVKPRIKIAAGRCATWISAARFASVEGQENRFIRICI